MNIRIHINTYICMCISKERRLYMYSNTYEFVYIYICIYAYTHTCIYARNIMHLIYNIHKYCTYKSTISTPFHAESRSFGTKNTHKAFSSAFCRYIYT